jgi:hypothetical protein
MSANTHDEEQSSIAQWGCLAGVLGIIALTIIGGVWLFSRSNSPAEPEGPRPTAIVWTATPTPTPTVQPTPTPQPVAPGTIGVGVQVEVSGTGNAGLSIRAEPDTNAERRDVANEGEVLIVVSGPQEGDGYTWWFVRDEANPEREGWAAEDFLTPSQ